MATAPRNRVRRLARRAVLAGSVCLTSALIAIWIFAQFRTPTFLRTAFHHPPTGSARTVSMLHGWAPGLVVDHLRDDLYFPVPTARPDPQRPYSHFAIIPSATRPGPGQILVPDRVRFLGFRLGHQRTVTAPVNTEPTRVGVRTIVVVPWWLLTTLAATPAAVRALRHALTRPARRRAQGLCPRCAYDLAGLTPGPCPECGLPSVPPPR